MIRTVAHHNLVALIVAVTMAIPHRICFVIIQRHVLLSRLLIFEEAACHIGVSSGSVPIVHRVVAIRRVLQHLTLISQ